MEAKKERAVVKINAINEYKKYGGPKERFVQSKDSKRLLQKKRQEREKALNK